MRFLVVCQVDGTVVSMMSAPVDGPRPYVPALPMGQQVVEVDVADITDYMEDVEVHRRLEDLALRHRVDAGRMDFVPR